MRKLVFGIICVTLFLPMMINAETIDKNRIVELNIPKDATVSFRIMFRAGTQYDPVGKEGLAYITARLLSEGSTTANRYETILKKLFPLAASFNVDAGREIAVFNGRVHKDNLKVYYELFKQQMLSPAFREDELARVKQDALNYLQNDLKYSNDEEFGKAILYGEVFKNTPYAHNDIGTIAGLNSITITDVKEFYTKYYNRKNFVLGIGGGYDKKLVQSVWDDFSMLPVGTEAVPPKIEPANLNGLNLVLVEKKANATAISIGYPINLVRGNKDWYALAIANSWLGEHRNSSSHLYQVIREARGLNYGDYSYIEHYPNGGRLQLPPVNVPRRQQMFEIWIRPVPNENAHFALRAAMRELKHLIENGLTKEQFELTRKFLKNYVLQYAPTTNKRLAYALDDKFYNLKSSHLAQFRKMMDELTLQDVNQAVKKYLQDKNMTIAVITNNAADLASAIESNKPSPIKYATPKPQSVLAEDESISVYPLSVDKKNVYFRTLEELFK